MKIGLLDVDSHNFPNLCLMKLSAYHKAKGDDVEMLNGFLHYDKVYVSKVFDNTYTPDYLYPIYADEIVKGGTGYNLTNTLPYEIEHIMPDYSLYNINEMAYGFLTRGCPRGCKFCIVGEKEGLKSHQVADLDEFYSGQKFINLLDPNILGAKNADALLEKLVKTGAYVEFNQGLDARFLTKERIQILSHLNVRMIHFAWDNPNDTVTPVKLQQFADAKITDNKRKVHVYVLTNFGSSHEEDLERVYRLREMGFTPYIMIYDKPHAPKLTRRLARWVNNKWFFNACEKFEEFTG